MFRPLTAIDEHGAQGHSSLQDQLSREVHAVMLSCFAVLVRLEEGGRLWRLGAKCLS